MAPDTTARDGEAELATIAFLGHQIDPGRAQPADRQILELMTDREDPQRLPVEIGTLILGRTDELELKRAFASMPEARRAEIGPGRSGLAFGDVLGDDNGSDSPDLNPVLSFLAAQKPEEIVTLPTGEQVAVDQLLTSVKSAVDAAAKEASENVKDAKAVVAPIKKLDLAKDNIMRAGAALAKARSQNDWDEGALKEKIEEVKAALNQIETM